MYLDSCEIFSEFGAFDKAKMQRKSAYGAGAATDEHSSKARVEASAGFAHASALMKTGIPGTE